MPLDPTLLRRFLQPAAVGLVLLLCAVFNGGSQIEYDSREIVQSFSSREDRGAKVIEPRQVPLARSAGRASHALRSKGSSKSKHPALLAVGPARLTAVVEARGNDVLVPPEPQGFLQLRTQNPRAPPFTRLPA